MILCRRFWCVVLVFVLVLVLVREQHRMMLFASVISNFCMEDVVRKDIPKVRGLAVSDCELFDINEVHITIAEMVEWWFCWQGEDCFAPYILDCGGRRV